MDIEQGPKPPTTCPVRLFVCLPIVFAIAFAACTTARSDENVRLETARAVGGVTSDQVTVANLHVGMKTATWEADTRKGHYRCEADDMLKHPANCVEQ